MTLFDPGLQPERTRLAWRRTLLALTVIALAALRLLPDELGPAGAVLPALALVGVGGLWAMVFRRTRGVDGALADERPLPGAGAPVLLSLTCGIVALSGLVLVVGLALT